MSTTTEPPPGSADGRSLSASSANWWWVAVGGSVLIALIGLGLPRLAGRAALIMGIVLATILVAAGISELVKRFPRGDRTIFRRGSVDPMHHPAIPIDVMQLQPDLPDSPLTAEAAKAITDVATERLWSAYHLNLYDATDHETIRNRVSPGLWSVFSSTQHRVATPTHRDLDQLLDELEAL